MLIQKVSMLTGKLNEMDIPVTPQQISAWRKGALIQNAMPNLSPEQREFLITGSTPNEWSAAFSEAE